jgi:uncharacterized membrane protein
MKVTHSTVSNDSVSSQNANHIVPTSFTERERLVAGGLNIAAIFMPYIGPIIGYAMAGKSSFVRFHALRCIIEQVVMTVVLGTLMVLSLIWTVYNLYQTGFDLQKIDWAFVIGKAVVTWLLLGLLNILNFINGVRDGLQAFQGKYPTRFKWTERIAAKMSGFKPNL